MGATATRRSPPRKRRQRIREGLLPRGAGRGVGAAQVQHDQKATRRGHHDHAALLRQPRAGPIICRTFYCPLPLNYRLNVRFFGRLQKESKPPWKGWLALVVKQSNVLGEQPPRVAQQLDRAKSEQPCHAGPGGAGERNERMLM